MASSRHPTSWCECERLTSRSAERGCTLARAGPALRSAAPSLRAHTRLSRPPSRSGAPGAQRPGDPWPPILTPALEPCPRTPSPTKEAQAGHLLVSFGATPLLLHLPVSARTVLLSFQSVNFTCSQLPQAPLGCPPNVPSVQSSLRPTPPPKPPVTPCQAAPRLPAGSAPRGSISFVLRFLCPSCRLCCPLRASAAPWSPHTVVPARPVSSLPSSRASRDQPGTGPGLWL